MEAMKSSESDKTKRVEELEKKIRELDTLLEMQEFNKDLGYPIQKTTKVRDYQKENNFQNNTNKPSPHKLDITYDSKRTITGLSTGSTCHHRHLNSTGTSTHNQSFYDSIGKAKQANERLMILGKKYENWKFNILGNHIAKEGRG
jgi:hypothetical protein